MAMTEQIQEINTIRNILMGQQMTEYQSRFEELSHKLQDQYNRMEEMNRQLQEQLTALRLVVDQNQADIHQRLESVGREDRHRIGQLLKTFGDQLLTD